LLCLLTDKQSASKADTRPWSWFKA
jgi:hypothetical protein